MQIPLLEANTFPPLTQSKSLFNFHKGPLQKNLVLAHYFFKPPFNIYSRLRLSLPNYISYKIPEKKDAIRFLLSLICCVNTLNREMCWDQEGSRRLAWARPSLNPKIETSILECSRHRLAHAQNLSGLEDWSCSRSHGHLPRLFQFGTEQFTAPNTNTGWHTVAL